mmetsp:Transcript_27459/g.43240  ORF Transcript_27459/g.43240 Transcript_27459/m.43240 type:complete len:94 (-) Transcript_27459:483-764(-)
MMIHFERMRAMSTFSVLVCMQLSIFPLCTNLSSTNAEDTSDAYLGMYSVSFSPDFLQLLWGHEVFVLCKQNINSRFWLVIIFLLYLGRFLCRT